VVEAVVAAAVLVVVEASVLAEEAAVSVVRGAVVDSLTPVVAV
jgi:hypothetical protein